MPILTGSAPKALKTRGRKGKKSGIPKARRPSSTGKGKSKTAKPTMLEKLIKGM